MMYVTRLGCTVPHQDEAVSWNLWLGKNSGISPANSTLSALLAESSLWGTGVVLGKALSKFAQTASEAASTVKKNQLRS